MKAMIFRRFIGRDLLKNRTRSLLTLLGIALGVAILLAIQLANHTAVAQFRQSVDQVSGKANLEVRATAQPAFTETLLARLHWLDRLGVKRTPIVEQTAVTPDGEVLQALGVDMLADPEFRTLDWDFVSPPKDPFDLFAPRHVLVSDAFAERQGLKQGHSLEVFINDTRETLVVTGILKSQGVGKAYGGNVLLMDVSVAQSLFAMPGQLSRIDLWVPNADAIGAIEADLTSTLPGTVTVQRPARRGAQVETMLRAFQANLTALSFVSLLVGMFLIYNTMSISVLRRRSEIGTLRALGATRGQIFKLFTQEALLLGGLGSLLGVGLGLLLATQTLSAVSQTVQTLYVAQRIETLTVDPGLLLLAFTLGVGLTLLAALPPVWEAATVAPADASKRATYEPKVPRVALRLLWAGLGLLAVAGLLSQQPPVAGLPVFGYAAALCIVLGSALTLPWCLQRSLTAMAPLAERLFGPEGRLSVLNLKGSLGRTSVAVASLMIGIALMMSLAVMIGSFRQTVIQWVNQTVRADLWIEPLSRGSSLLTGRIQPKTLQTVANTPGVEAIDAFYEFPIQYRGESTNLATGNLEVLSRHGALLFVDGSDDKTVMTRLAKAPSVLVTESFALKFNHQTGDAITLQTPTGPHTLTIAGVYTDYASERGYIVMPRSLYQRLYQDNSVSNLAVYLKPGFSARTVRDDVLQRLGPQTRLNITTNQDLRAEVLRIFDSTFSITYALHLIAIAVAVLSVMNTLFALVLEMRRDLGILRYLGATRQRVQRLILVQAGTLGLLGNVAGLAVGLMLAALLIFVINRQSFGWTIQWETPWAFLLQSAAIVLLTAILAGWLPARAASRLPAPAAVREE